MPNEIDIEKPLIVVSVSSNLPEIGGINLAHLISRLLAKEGYKDVNIRSSQHPVQFHDNGKFRNGQTDAQFNELKKITILINDPDFLEDRLDYHIPFKKK